MWAGFFCRQDVSISIFGRTKEFSEVRGTSLMCNFGVHSRFLYVIYGVRPPNGSPDKKKKFSYFSNKTYVVGTQKNHLIELSQKDSSFEHTKLFLSKTVLIRAGLFIKCLSEKQTGKTLNRLQMKSDLGLHCFSKPFD